MFNRSRHVILKNIKRPFSNLSYKHNIGTEPLRYVTIGNLLEETANKYPDRNVVISKHQNKSLTFAQALQEADKLAAGFRRLGIERNDRLGIWAPNLLEWYIIKMACARAGIIMVALNPGYQPPEMEYCINKVGLKALVCGERYKKEEYYQHLLAIAPELAKSDAGRLKSTKVPTLQTIITLSGSPRRGTYNFAEVLDLANSSDIAKIQNTQSKIQPDEPFSLQFTSGTTGKPKAVLVNHFSMINNGYLLGKRLALSTKHHSICMQVPFFHAFGIVIAVNLALNHGATLVVPSEGYNSHKSLDAIRDEKCSTIYGTPTMYVDLVHNQEQRNEDITPEMAVVAGALCSPALLSKMSQILRVKLVKSVYGLTESTGGLFASLPDEDVDKTLTTVGHVAEHVEAKVVDKEGKLVPYGSEGELCVRSYSNMLEYWGDDIETKKALGQDGWLKTGDQFILDEDGYGRVVGRLKEIIIRGGENIFPKEIEEFLNTHPDILETYVIGLPHERLGEEVCACIRTKDNVVINLDTIARFCKGKISHFKIPSKVVVVEGFPKTLSGKIQKFKLKEIVINATIK